MRFRNILAALIVVQSWCAAGQQAAKIEKAPEFPGGMAGITEYLDIAIRYPDEARRNKIEGSVLVKFTVNADGGIENVAVQRSVQAVLDSEAVRVIRAMPNWTPAQAQGKPVSASMALPINFSLGNGR